MPEALAQNCEILGFDGGDYEDYCLLECDKVPSGRRVLVFHGNILPPLSTLIMEAVGSCKALVIPYTTMQH
jgi:hypothetical protein